MKITQKQAIDAYIAVRKLENQDMPGREAMTLFMMRRSLEPQFRFQDEQEHRIIEQLGCRITERGEIQFPDVESKEKYIEKIEELNRLDVELDIEKTVFPIGNIRLSMQDIERLEPIFEIVC